MACPALQNPTNLNDINITVCPYAVEEPALTPGVMWAQRENYIFLTVCVGDCQTPEIGVFEDKLHFKGVGGPEMRRYELDIQLLHNIDIENSKYAVRPRVVEFRLEKEEHKWWERLLLDKNRQHWLRIDFQKWRDEEDVGDEKEPFEEEDAHRMTPDYSKHIAENIVKGSSMCPIGMDVMGDSMAMGMKPPASAPAGGKLVKPSPQQQAMAMTSLDIYGYDTGMPDSDDEKLSDLDE